MRKVFLALLLAVAISAFAQNGVMKELTGEVELKTSGSANFVKAKAGDLIASDTIVSTGFRSTANIEVGSSLITVRPLTRLSLTEIRASSGTETVNVSLQTGRLRVDVKPPAGAKASFTVQSPSVTASVRGTSFDIGIANLNVHEGRVAFSGNSGLNIIVAAGYQTQINPDGGIADPVTIRNGELTVPPPVGSGLSGESTTPQPRVQDGTFTVGIEFPSEE